MFDETVRKVRPCIKTAIVMGLVLAAAIAAKAQTQEESFEENMRKAVEAQAKRNQADEDEQKRLVAANRARWEAMQSQEEAELRQGEVAFEQKMELRRMQEEARRQRQLESQLNDQSGRLANAVADLMAQMRSAEADSGLLFRRKREAFSQKLGETVAANLAKAEAEREQKKKIAMAAAITYFTGGAALPVMEAVGTDGMGQAIATATQGRGAALANPRKVETGNATQQHVPGVTSKPAGVKVYDAPAGPPLISSPTEPSLSSTLKTAWTCGSAVLGFAGCLEAPSPLTCGSFATNAYGCLDRLLTEQQGQGPEPARK